MFGQDLLLRKLLPAERTREGVPHRVSSHVLVQGSLMRILFSAQCARELYRFGIDARSLYFRSNPSFIVTLSRLLLHRLMNCVAS